MAVVGFIEGWEGLRGRRAGRVFPHTLTAVSVLLFAASTALTIRWSTAMAALPLCGGETMSMAWRRMPGDTWPGAAASFLGMWTAMTVAMMLPALLPTLWRYRQAVGDRLTALLGFGYFAVWSALGIVVFPLGVALAALEAQVPPGGMPVVVGTVLLIAGALQFTSWKAHHLTGCRSAPPCGGVLPGTAWRQGLRLGLHCSASCAGLTAILLVTGLMDLRAMALVTVAVSVERLAPAGVPVARAIGAFIVGTGAVVIARAAGLA